MLHILFGDPNRDLLRCYAVLLRGRGYAVTTVFDGAQVSEALARQPFALAILGDGLGRIGTEKLIPLLHEQGIPVLLLASGQAPTEADAVLPFPFLPQELYAAAEQILKKAGDPA